MQNSLAPALHLKPFPAKIESEPTHKSGLRPLTNFSSITNRESRERVKLKARRPPIAFPAAAFTRFLQGSELNYLKLNSAAASNREVYENLSLPLRWVEINPSVQHQHFFIGANLSLSFFTAAGMEFQFIQSAVMQP